MRASLQVIGDQLRVLRCNPREAALYLKSLQMGPASVQELARALRRNRVTVHSEVEQLLEKGLLFETRRGRRRLIVAEEPVGLLRLLQKQENEFQIQRRTIEQLIPALTSLQAIDVGFPSVKFYEGAEGFRRMLEETLSARGEVLVFSYVPLFSDLVGTDYLLRYFRRRSAKGIHTRLIFPPCRFAEVVHVKAKEFKIQVRLLPPTLHWKSGIFVWNDCLAIMSYTAEKLTCTIIENRDIAYFYRNIIFELCWDQANPL